MADEDREENRVTFTFPDHGRSHRPPWWRRSGGRRYHCHPGAHLDADSSCSGDSGDSSCASSSSSSSSSSGDRYGVAAWPRRRRRHHHQHHHRRPGALVLGAGALARLARPAAPAPAQPRSYGYRRLHVQGGPERGPRRARRGRQGHGHGHDHDHHCHRQQQQQQQQRRCILARCCRWLFGDPPERCSCRGGNGARCCGGDGASPSPSPSRSPTRHREEDYWGPGTHNWAYGPPGAGGGWRDTPWAGGPGAGAGNNNNSNPYNLAPGGVVEEIEEGGTLAAGVAAGLDAGQDVTHNHYHLGERRHRRGGRGRRGSSFMRECAGLARDRERDDGVLGLVDRERDRELDRNMVDRESANRRDLRMMALLDRERERDRGGTDLMGLLERELERRRDLRPGEGGKRTKAREGSDSGDEGGLRAEIEALRKDFKKLLRNPPAAGSSSGPEKGRRGVSGSTSVASRSSGYQRPSPAVDIEFSPGNNAASDNGGGDDGEDDDGDRDDEYESSESSSAQS